jgi:hypothetical protein
VGGGLRRSFPFPMIWNMRRMILAVRGDKNKVELGNRVASSSEVSQVFGVVLTSALVGSPERQGYAPCGPDSGLTVANTRPDRTEGRSPVPRLPS